ncbi:unnamed protein product, partial [Ixodes persulcatus]
MVMMWIFATYPYQLTALLPLLLFPFLGICKLKDLAKLYFSDSVVTLLCCSAFSECLDRSGLLRRVSLQLLRLRLMDRPLFLLMLFGFSTALVAALARRTLAVTLMSAMTRALVVEIKIAVEAKYTRGTLQRGPEGEPNFEEDVEIKKEIDDFSALLRALLMMVVFCAHFGAFLLPTGSNELLDFKALSDRHLRELSLSQPGFWLLTNGPCTLVLVVFNALYFHLLHVRKLFRNTLRKSIVLSLSVGIDCGQSCERNLVRPPCLKKCFLFVFCASAFSAEGSFKAKVSPVIGYKCSVTDATPAVLLMVVFAFLPLQALQVASNDRVFRWKSILPQIPWGLCLVLGSGNAVAHASKNSGMTDILLHLFGDSKEPIGKQLQLSASVALASQLAPGQLDDRLFRSILERTSSGSEHALYYLLPAATASTFTYLLPCSNAANLLVYHYSRIKLTDMV